jgi:hypothetical protein
MEAENNGNHREVASSFSHAAQFLVAFECYKGSIAIHQNLIQQKAKMLNFTEQNTCLSHLNQPALCATRIRQQQHFIYFYSVKTR